MNGSSSTMAGMDPDSSAVMTRTCAAVALQDVRAKSLPAAIACILQITCRGLPARRSAFWRPDGDNGDLRLFCRADRNGLLRTRSPSALLQAVDVPDNVLSGSALYWHSRATDAALANALQTGVDAPHVLAMPVRSGDVLLGLLCVERKEPGPADGEAELFLRLVAARIEAACHSDALMEGSTPPAASTYALHQSHLVLSDESLRDLFFLAPTAMLLTEIEDARPLAANRHALSLFRISAGHPDTVLAADFWEDTEDRQRFVAKALADGHVRDHRARLRRADGTVFWGLVSATLIDHGGRTALMSSVADVSDTVAAEEILNRTRQTLTTLLEASPYPLIVTRLDNGEIRYCNQKAADMFESPLSALLGHTAPEFYVDPSDRRFFVEKLRSVGKVEGFVAELKTPGGEPFWAMLSAKTLELNGEPVFMVAFADVTRQKRKEAELENLAFRDALTNAYNRRYFIEAARIELGRAERSRQPPSVTLLDIDHFKQLNDTHGHEVGDSVLREFVALVQSMLRKTDILARYGGEEFAILFPETGLDVARSIVERICATVAEHRFPTGATASSVTFSAGIAEARAKEEYQPLIMRADDALYAAKDAGRNRVHS